MFKPYNEYERIYFSRADRQIEVLLDDELAFDRSLLVNVLFQPQVLIPDIFFFISSGVERQVLQSPTPQSLLEASIAAGVVIPAFRDSSCSSFNDALSIMRGRGEPLRAIQGLRDPRSNERLADRLQLATRSSAFTPAFWPDHDIGAKYEQIILKHLTLTNCPWIDPAFGVSEEEFKRIWDLSKVWRTDCVWEAIENTRRVAGHGLRRGELLNAIGRTLGFPPQRRVDDSREILAQVDEPQIRRALEVFLRWMTDLYQYNQATEFRCAPTFPSYEPMSGPVTSQLLPQIEESETESCLDLPVLREQVRLPPMRVLHNLPPADLLRLRTDYGARHFAALSSWQRDPSDQNVEELQTSLREYSDKIVKWSSKQEHFSSVVLDMMFGAQTPPLRRVLTSVIGVGGAIAAVYLPWATPLLAIGGAGYAVYIWHASRPEMNEITFGSPIVKKLATADVNLIASSSENSDSATITSADNGLRTDKTS